MTSPRRRPAARWRFSWGADNATTITASRATIGAFANVQRSLRADLARHDVHYTVIDTVGGQMLVAYTGDTRQPWCRHRPMRRSRACGVHVELLDTSDGSYASR